MRSGTTPNGQVSQFFAFGSLVSSVMVGEIDNFGRQVVDRDELGARLADDLRQQQRGGGPAV